jgi:hypothetical protein
LLIVPTTKEVAMIENKDVSKENIARRAYELYTQRGCKPGNDVEDWLNAEKELGAEPVIIPARANAAHPGRFN